MVTSSEYNPDACFRSWRIQQSIIGFTPDEVRQVRAASKKSFSETIHNINQIKNRKEVIHI